ncbi:hypothetical protein [Gemmata sp.]|uniref:hypothetical protein n=1 Tax=Gemmata sp. TaxID=1914242 RepID=UPI003F6F8A7D
MHAIARLLLVAAVAVAAGCGRSDQFNVPDMGGEDGKQIATLVDRLNDDSTRPAQLKQLFAAGATADSRALRQYRFDLKDKPAVSGGTATGTVVLEKASGHAMVEKEWAFVKEGDKWKIKAAPLQ